MKKNELLKKYNLLNTVELDKSQSDGLVKDFINEFNLRAKLLPEGTNLIRYNHFVKEFEDYFIGVDNKTSANMDAVWKSVNHYINDLKLIVYPEIAERRDAIFTMKNFELVAWFKENSNREVLPFQLQEEKLIAENFEKDDVVQFAVYVYNSRLVTYLLRKQGLTKTEIKYVKMLDKFAVLVSKLATKMNERTAYKNLLLNESVLYTESELNNITYALLEKCDGKQVPFIIASNEFLKGLN